MFIIFIFKIIIIIIISVVVIYYYYHYFWFWVWITKIVSCLKLKLFQLPVYFSLTNFSNKFRNMQFVLSFPLLNCIFIFICNNQLKNTVLLVATFMKIMSAVYFRLMAFEMTQWKSNIISWRNVLKRIIQKKRSNDIYGTVQLFNTHHMVSCLLLASVLRALIATTVELLQVYELDKQ